MIYGKSLWICMVFCCMAISLEAQYYNQRQDFLRANSIWTFGRNIGLDFNGGVPAAFRSATTVNEGAASVAHRITGELLFYSDGKSCWNRNHALMPNGDTLLGNRASTTQGVCIVPVIDTPDKYYLFSLQGYELAEGKLWYSVVDMREDNGLGDVEPNRKNILLDSGLSESMIAIPGNRCDIWLVVHTRASDTFKAYRITGNGIDVVPVISVTGLFTGGSSFRQGALAVSPDRSRIAIASYAVSVFGGVIVARFDPATGLVSNPIMAETDYCFGVAFSPDNNLLYVRLQPPGLARYDIYQYDLSNWNSVSIQGSRTLIYDKLKSVGTFKLYNGMLFLGTGVYPYLDCINKPDLPGLSCDYKDSAILLAGTSNASLPNDVVLPLPVNAQLTIRKQDTFICRGQNNLLLPRPVMDPGHILSGWDNGTTDSILTVTRPGTYWHTTWYSGCRVVVDTFVVHERDLSFDISGDTVICNNIPVSLDIPVPGASYLWNDGSTGRVREITKPGRYWAKASLGSCTATDTVRVSSVNLPQNLGNDTMVCMEDPLDMRLMAYVPAGTSAIWNDGSTGDSLRISAPGIYWVQVDKDGCVTSDTLKVSLPDLQQNLGPDIFFCKADPVHLSLQTGTLPQGAGILWSDGSSGPALTIRDSGLYWITVRYASCSASDTIYIGKEICDCFLQMPDAFTPNSDGRNDLFRPVIEPGCPVRQCTLHIYNRWGQPVFQGDNPADGWDGTYQGVPAETGAYMYLLHFEGGTKGGKRMLKGTVTLVR